LGTSVAAGVFNADSLIASYGLLGLGFIIFAEIGLLLGVVLPGETLLVLAGAYSHGSAAHRPHFSLIAVMVVAAVGAIGGGFCGYVIGYRVGPPLFHRPNSRIFRPVYVERTHHYFERYGVRTVLVARFVPFVRTLASPAAGIGQMRVASFATYNVIGGLVWAVVIPLIGFGLAHAIPVSKNVLPITLVVGAVSCIPLVTEWVRHRRRAPVAP
jgi:membrane-associated protein